MHIPLNPILSIGLILFLSIFFAKLANKVKLPSITGYIILGIVIGPYLLNLIDRSILKSSGFISTLALSLIAFGLGPSFTLSNLKKTGKSVLAISIGEVLGSFILVTLAVWLIAKQPLNVAMLIGAIAPATAPAAIVMVTREYKARGIFTDTLLGVVAIDDAWGIILFGVVIALTDVIGGKGSTGFVIHEILKAVIEIFGSLIIGFVMGIILKLLIKITKTSSQLLTLVLSVVITTGGISVIFGFSPLLSGMALGATIANLTKTNKVFETLKSVDTPIYIIFFVLAGATLELGNLSTLGLLGILFVLTRLPGEMIGAFIGAVISKAPANVRKYLGLALAPQAGVAIGLAIIAAQRLGDTGSMILATIIVTTVIYELIGPILVKIALQKAGDIKAK